MAVKPPPLTALLGTVALLGSVGGVWWWAQAADGAAPTTPATQAAGTVAAQTASVSGAQVIAAAAVQPAEMDRVAPAATSGLASAAPSPSACLGVAPMVPKASAPPYPMSGRLGLWVAEINPDTLQIVKAVSTNPDSVFPLASTYKQAVLWAVLREFDAGRLAPTERLDVTPASQSMGEYPFDGSNVRVLTERMIRNSDNTATDLLHRRVGLSRVQAVADDLGLCQTRLILPTKDWWVLEAGLSDIYLQNPGWWQSPDRAALAARLDAEAQTHSVGELGPQLDRYFESLHQPQDDLGSHNLSTPYEFATLLAHEYLRSGLSERAGRWQGEVAALGYGKAGLKAGQVGNIATFYGKGGNGWRLLTYTGYFKTKDGHHVVYAFMQHGADQWYTMPNTFRAFAWINAAVDEVIGKQKPPKAPTPQPKTSRLTTSQPKTAASASTVKSSSIAASGSAVASGAASELSSAP